MDMEAKWISGSMLYHQNCNVEASTECGKM